MPLIQWIAQNNLNHSSIIFNSDADRMSRTTSLPNPHLWTVCFFMKFTTAVPGVDQEVFALDNGDPGVTGYQTISLAGSDGRTLVAFVNSPIQDIISDPLTPGRWYFIAFVADGINQTVYYGDQEVPASALVADFVTGNASYTAASLTVGGSIFAEPPTNDIKICGVKIWDAGLTPAELETERQSFTAKRTANLNSSYIATGILADRFTDTSGNGLTLTSHGGTVESAEGPTLSPAPPATTYLQTLTAALSSAGAALKRAGKKIVGFITPAITENGVAFNSTTDALKRSSLPTNNTSYSVCGWAKYDSTTADDSLIFVSDAAGTGLALEWKTGVQKLVDTFGFTRPATVGGALVNQKWYFIGLKVNGTTATIYQGSETSTCINSSGTIVAQGASSLIWFGYISANLFTGALAFWKLYDAQLTDAEFEAERLAATPIRSANLTGFWKFSSVATKLVDSSGNSNTLTADSTGPWEDVLGPQLGNLKKRTSKLPVGAITPAGALVKRTKRALAGAVSFVGTLVKRTSKKLAGTLSSAGALIKRTNKKLAGALSPAATLIKRTFHKLAGSITPVATLVKKTKKFFVGSLSFVGALAKRAGKKLAGALTSSGALIKRTGKKVVGALSPAATLIKRTSKKLAGVLTSNATLVGVRTIMKALAGALNFAGGIVKRTGKKLSGAITPAATLIKRTRRALAGALSFSGALKKRTGKAISAAATFVGNIVKRTNKKLAGSLSPVGTLIKRTKKFAVGTLSFSGSIAKRAGKKLVGSLSSSASLVRRTGKRVSGSLSPAATLSKRIFHKLVGSLTPVGTLTKRTRRALAGVVNFSATVFRAFPKSLSGALSMGANLTRRTGKKAVGALSFVGAIKKRISRHLVGVLSFSSTTFASHLFMKALAGALSFSSTVRKRTGHVLQAALGFTGSISKRTKKAIVAALSFASNLHIGAFNYFINLAGSVGFSGAPSKRIKKVVAGVVGFFRNLRVRSSRKIHAIIVGTTESSNTNIKKGPGAGQ